MASYSLKASYPTVQVISPTIVEDIQYCTIQTQPSDVIASIPISAVSFSQNQGAVQLTNFANAIETLMNIDSVIAGIGSQQLDANGLLADYVDFTVQYPATGAGSTSVTGIASVPVTMLDFTDGAIGAALHQQAETIINNVYNSLKSLAGG